MLRIQWLKIISRRGKYFFPFIGRSGLNIQFEELRSEDLFSPHIALFSFPSPPLCFQRVVVVVVVAVACFSRCWCSLLFLVLLVVSVFCFDSWLWVLSLIGFVVVGCCCYKRFLLFLVVVVVVVVVVSSRYCFYFCCCCFFSGCSYLSHCCCGCLCRCCCCCWFCRGCDCSLPTPFPFLCCAFLFLFTRLHSTRTRADVKQSKIQYRRWCSVKATGETV